MRFSGYALVRSRGDRHVYSSGHNRYLPLIRSLSHINDLDSLIRLIPILMPASCNIEPLSSDDNSPSERLIASLHAGEVSDIRSQKDLTWIDAAGDLIRSRLDIPFDLRFLKAIPPEDIHSMQRGPYWVGDVYSSDMIVSAFSTVGLALKDGMSFLDYGCSSGSMLRILAWAYPNVRFFGTDPVRSSIAWAAANLQRRNLSFLDQDQVPPLPFGESSFDRVAAVSIFSHHGLAASKRWFDELARIMKPGGALSITTHGPGSVLFYCEERMKPVERYREILAAMIANGYAFEETWLGTDDVGNISTEAEWGNSFFTPDVIQTLIADSFVILLYKQRANQNNQDLYVLQRKLN